MNQKRYDQYIKSFAEKWLNGAISPAEEQEFAQWYNQFQDEEELPLSESVAENRDELKNKIYAAIV